MQAELESPEAYARQIIAHALRRAPHDVWTRDALASGFGISASLAGKVLAELVRAGIARRVDGSDDEYSAATADY